MDDGLLAGRYAAAAVLTIAYLASWWYGKQSEPSDHVRNWLLGSSALFAILMLTLGNDTNANTPVAQGGGPDVVVVIMGDEHGTEQDQGPSDKIENDLERTIVVADFASDAGGTGLTASDLINARLRGRWVSDGHGGLSFMAYGVLKTKERPGDGYWKIETDKITHVAPKATEPTFAVKRSPETR